MRIRLNPSQRVFLICLVLAASSWLSLKLSSVYTFSMPLRLQFDHLPRGLYINSDNSLQLPARIRAKGYRLLAFNWFEGPYAVLDAQRIFKRRGAFYYWIPARDRLRINASLQAYDLLDLPRDSLIYPMEKTLRKRLPIKLSGRIGFARGYDGVGVLQKVPDSVWVTAPDAILDTLRFIATLPYRAQNLRRDLSAVLQLVNPDSAKLRMAVDTVTISWAVDRFTEGGFTLPVTKPPSASGGRLKLFPPTVKVRFRVALSHYEEVQAADFQVGVDMTHLMQNLPYLPLELLASPKGVKNVEIHPKQVEYLILER